MIDGNLFPVADNRCQHADDMLVCDSIFLAPPIIAANDIVILTDFQNTVQDILPLSRL